MPMKPRAYGHTSPSALLAYQTAAQLRIALGRAGFEPDYDFPTMHGDTTVSDEPFVTFGRCTVDVVQRLLVILHAAARSAALAEPAQGPELDPPIPTRTE